jgi:hypothetical protein
VEKTNGNEARPQRGALTERQARELAKGDRHYVARQNGSGEWLVWDCVSDHRVEFDHVPLTLAEELAKDFSADALRQCAEHSQRCARFMVEFGSPNAEDLKTFRQFALYARRLIQLVEASQ